MNRLFEHLPGALLPWYRRHARDLPWRRDQEPYHVWISEIMLQQTRVEAVLGYYARFLEAFPTIQALAQAEEGQLLKLWEGLGYYSRARNLQKAARVICGEYGGHFPTEHALIRALPGVGPYTAGAIASICFGQPTPAVDGNVLRVAARLADDHAPIDLPATKKRITEELSAVYPAGSCGDFTQALMELGATVCTPRSPKCENCPCAEFCLAKKRSTAPSLPVKLPKKDKRVEEKTVFLLYFEDKLALCRRPESGLLAGLWQLPNVPGALGARAALEQAAAFGVRPADLQRELHKVHIFTHIRWEMTAYVISCREAAPQFVWAAPEELEQVYALPTAFRQFLDEE